MSPYQPPGRYQAAWAHAAVMRQFDTWFQPELCLAVRVDDVVAMHRAGVQVDLIANHVRANGMAAPGRLVRENTLPGRRS